MFTVTQHILPVHPKKFHFYGLPHNAKILTIGHGSGPGIMAWAIVEEGEPTVQRNFRWLENDEPFDPVGHTYIGTISILGKITHLFELEHGCPAYCHQVDALNS